MFSRHPILGEDDTSTSEEQKTQIISFFTIFDSIPRSLVVLNIASILARNSFRVLVVDLDFEPRVSLLLKETIPNLNVESTPLNQWWLDEINDKELLDNVIVFKDSTEGELHILPSSKNIAEKRKVLALSEHSHRRGMQKLLILMEKLKEDSNYDFIILNLQDGVSSLTASGVFASDFSFLVVDDNILSLSLSAESVEILQSFHPFLNIDGILLHGFKFSATSSSDEKAIVEIEKLFQLPILMRCPLVPDLMASRQRKLDLLPGNPISKGYQWDYYQDLTSSIVGYTRNPDRHSVYAVKRYHSLIIANESGVPLYSCHFDQRTVKVQDELASAALTSFLSAIGFILREITEQSDRARLIEQEDVKVFIEEYKRIKAFLITSHYSDEMQIRNKLRMFLQSFVKRFQDIIADWDGSIDVFSHADEMVKQIFDLKPFSGYNLPNSDS